MERDYNISDDTVIGFVKNIIYAVFACLVLRSALNVIFSLYIHTSVPTYTYICMWNYFNNVIISFGTLLLIYTHKVIFILLPTVILSHNLFTSNRQLQPIFIYICNSYLYYGLISIIHIYVFL